MDILYVLSTPSVIDTACNSTILYKKKVALLIESWTDFLITIVYCYSHTFNKN